MFIMIDKNHLKYSSTLNKIKVNPDQRAARPDYNWRKHITVKKITKPT